MSQVKEYNLDIFVNDVAVAADRTKRNIWLSFNCNYKIYSTIAEVIRNAYRVSIYSFEDYLNTYLNFWLNLYKHKYYFDVCFFFLLVKSHKPYTITLHYHLILPLTASVHKSKKVFFVIER